MALTPAQKQRRYREKLKARAETRADMIEAALTQEAERREELSDEERAALADKLSDIARGHLWRAHELAELARKVRPEGWNPPGAPK
jgi:hypothetical protein